MTTSRRTLILTTGALLAAPRLAAAQETPGVTATEIRIGSTNALSGPASTYSVITKCLTAMFQRLNDQGGVGGRKIAFIAYDDAYQPPRTLEQTRRLVEQDKVAFLFNQLGTPTNSAIHRYVNQRKVPHLFLATGADKWANPKEYPWTIGWQPSYRTEAQIYAKYILEQKPNAKIGLLYQNDDFGKDFVVGIRDILGPRFDAQEPHEKAVDRLCELNVIEQALNVCQTTVVQDAWARGHQVTVHGWIYRLQDGELRDLGASASSAEDVEAAIKRACDRLSAS